MGVLFALLAPFLVHTLADLPFSVQGTVKGISTGYVYFGYTDAVTGRLSGRMDSARITNGKFLYTGTVPEPAQISIGLRNGRLRFFSPRLFLDKGVLTMDIDVNKPDEMQAKGNASQDQLNAFNDRFDPILKRGNAAYGARLRAVKQHNKRAIDSLDNVFIECRSATVELVKQEVQAHPNSTVSAFIVTRHLVPIPDAEVLKPLYHQLSVQVRSSAYGKIILKAVEAGDRTAIGVKAPAFVLPDIARKKVSLDTYKGKYTLIDFWASWCGPCRAENPNVLEAYKRFHTKGFDVLSISLDDSRGNWIKAVNEDKLPWTQVSDLKGSASPVKNVYGIKSIPMNYLLDREGKIVAKNLRGAQLTKKLAELLP
jgi:peroxiredoxin